MNNLHSQAFVNMFREYDIRGRVNEEELNYESVYLIISAYGKYLQQRSINRAVVGYDNRSDSEDFAEAAIDALRDSGIDVISVGLSISPSVYFAQYHYECEGAVMITASHNPNGWSGFKLANGYSKTLGPEDIKELLSLVNETEDKAETINKGTLQVDDVREAYLESIVSRIKMGPNKPKLVIDAGNGGAGLFAYELFYRLGCLTFQLNCDPDTSYPHYFPNPSDLVERQRLREMVTHPYIKADLGIGFDGDGDRIGVLDDQGSDIWSDTVLAVLAKQQLEIKPNSTVVFDVKCSKALEEVIEQNGGIPLMWKTGHSYIKSKMFEAEADLAGERSGHIFFGKSVYLGFDDALFAGAKLVEYLSRSEDKLSTILGSFPKYVTSPEIKAHCKDEDKYKIVESIIQQMKGLYPGRVIDINGARVNFDYGWGLVRASSNLPELVLIFEADTQDNLNEIREIYRNILDQYPEVDSKWENDFE